MSELNRKGHRERMKESYLRNSFESMPDHNILELLLFYAIPQKDTKPLAYDLINHFGSFENVINADIEELVKVKGVKEHTAILIDLIKHINLRMCSNEAKHILCAADYKVTEEYVKTRLGGLQTEKVLVISLDNGLNFINDHLLGNGVAGFANLDPREMLSLLIVGNDGVFSLLTDVETANYFDTLGTS